MGNLVFIFPGQGSQYAGMGKEMYNKYQSARAVFEEANDVLQFNLSQMCFEGSLDELTKTENTQPAILAVSVAAYRIYMEEIGRVPVYAAGHSLGEFSALTCAGVISFSDALRIVRQRGLFMQEAAAEGIGAMCAVVGISKEIIEAECRNVSDSANHAVISNYNSSEQIVISGHREAVQKAGKRLESQGARIIFLKVSAPFHSSLMNSAAIKLEEELTKYEYGKFKWPVVSNVTGRPYSESGQVIENLTAQMTSPVKWDTSMQYFLNQGINKAVELGPQLVLTHLMNKNAKEIACFPFEKQADIAAAKKELADEQMRWDSTHNVVTKCLAAAVCTRNRNWDNEEYQKGVLEPNRNIQRIQEQLDTEGKAPDYEQMKEALTMLKLIFDTKKVSMAEQGERFKEILDETGTYPLFSSLYTINE